MSETEVTDTEAQMGPIDYLVVQYPNGEPTGEALPHLIDLVDRGMIRVLDLAFVLRSATGQATRLTVDNIVAAGAPEYVVFEGAESGLLDDQDLADVAAVLDPGAIGAIMVYENSWAAPFATSLRKAGAQLVASGRIPIQAMLATLDADTESPEDERN